MVSAIKIGGVPLYKLARKGQEVVREPRFVRVYDYEITRFAPPEIDFRVVCSKGFYVRTYAHDIGQKLGCGAHLSALRRTRSGHFKLLPGKHVTFDMLKEGRARRSPRCHAQSLRRLQAARRVSVRPMVRCRQGWFPERPPF
jgi:tRNA pseudouridine55 synthase